MDRISFVLRTIQGKMLNYLMQALTVKMRNPSYQTIFVNIGENVKLGSLDCQVHIVVTSNKDILLKEGEMKCGTTISLDKDLMNKN